MPTGQNTIYSSRKNYKLSVFRSWRDETRPQDMPGQAQGGQVYAFTRGLLARPGLKKIMEGVVQAWDVGIRLVLRLQWRIWFPGTTCRK